MEGIDMRLVLLAAALLLAPPLARACDTEVMNAELTRICRAALDPVLGWLDGIALPAPERARIATARSVAEQACDTGDPAAGVAAAARLARLAGRLETTSATPARHIQP
jgi:hypothetical protein